MRVLPLSFQLLKKELSTAISSLHIGQAYLLESMRRRRITFHYAILFAFPMMNVVGISLYLAMVSVLNISLAILKTSNSRSTRMKKKPDYSHVEADALEALRGYHYTSG